MPWSVVARRILIEAVVDTYPPLALCCAVAAAMFIAARGSLGETIGFIKSNCRTPLVR